MAKKKAETPAAEAGVSEPKTAAPKKTAKKAAEAPAAAAPAAAPAPPAPVARKGNKPRGMPAAKPAAAAPAQPMIDTSLAAENAAKLIGAKQAPAASAGDEPRKETSAFKQLKQSLNKPLIGGGNPLLSGHNTGGGKNKPNFFGGKQVGHNQTFGSGSSRSVPRRTSG